MPQLPPINLNSPLLDAPRRNTSTQRQQAENVSENQTVQVENRRRDVRLFPAINPGQTISELENDNRLVRGRQDNRNSPIGEYQTNQNIIEREEIDRLVGIDIFV